MAGDIRTCLEKILVNTVRNFLVMCLTSPFYTLAQNHSEGENSTSISAEFLEILSQNSLENFHIDYIESTKPLFYKMNANWSTYGYRDRGFKSNENEVTFNRIPFQNLEKGSPSWRYWGGLNDLFRYPESISLPLEVNEPSFLNNRSASEQYSTFAKNRSKKHSLTLSKAQSISYNNRLMYTYFSGLKPSGWAWNMSVSKRWSTLSPNHLYYNGYSYYLSVDKIIGKHNLNAVVFGSPTTRETTTAMTQEVYDLLGPSYNPKWGWHEGKKKSAGLNRYHVPKFILSHLYESNKTTINSSISYHLGKESRSKIIRGSGYYDDNGTLNVLSANSVYGDYYKYLPSYYLDEGLNPADAEIYNTDSDLVPLKHHQINWDYIYKTNQALSKQGKPSIYSMGEDVKKLSQLSIQSNIEQLILKDKGFISIGGLYQSNTTNYYTLLTDLLSGNPFIDVSSFYSGEMAYNNLNDRYRLKYPGEKIDYYYKIHSKLYRSTSYFSYKMNRIDAIFNISGGWNNHQRTGFFKNGRYINTSLGSSKKINYGAFAIRNRYNLKFSGKHMAKINWSYLSTPPNLENIFFDVRYANILVPDVSSSKSLNFNLSYLYRSETFRANINTYFSQKNDGTELHRYYVQSLGQFIHQSLNNVQTQHLGLEIATQWTLKERFTIGYAGAFSNAIYANNPKSWIISQDEPEAKYIGESYLKNYKLGGSPQQIHEVEMKFKSAHFFITSLSVVYLNKHYVPVSPFKHTQYFNFEDPKNGIPYADYSEEEAKSLLKQEKMNPSSWFINISFFKSWKIKRYRLGLSLFINNLLNKQGYRTGGFEQSRMNTFPLAKEEANRDTPLFGNKYWYLSGRTFFLNFYIRI